MWIGMEARVDRPEGGAPVEVSGSCPATPSATPSAQPSSPLGFLPGRRKDIVKSRVRRSDGIPDSNLVPGRRDRRHPGFKEASYELNALSTIKLRATEVRYDSPVNIARKESKVRIGLASRHREGRGGKRHLDTPTQRTYKVLEAGNATVAQVRGIPLLCSISLRSPSRLS
jgi:hypothetical protein